MNARLTRNLDGEQIRLLKPTEPRSGSQVEPDATSASQAKAHSAAEASAIAAGALASLSALGGPLEKWTNTFKAIASGSKLAKGGTNEEILGILAGVASLAALYAKELSIIQTRLSVLSAGAQVWRGLSDKSRNLALRTIDVLDGVLQLVPSKEPVTNLAKFILTTSLKFSRFCDGRAKESALLVDAEGNPEFAWQWAASQGIAAQTAAKEWTGSTTFVGCGCRRRQRCWCSGFDRRAA